MPISKLSASSTHVSYIQQCTARTPTRIHPRAHFASWRCSAVICAFGSLGCSPVLCHRLIPFPSLVCTQEEPSAVTALQRELGQLTLSDGAGLGFGKVCVCVCVRISVIGDNWSAVERPWQCS